MKFVNSWEQEGFSWYSLFVVGYLIKDHSTQIYKKSINSAKIES